MSDCLTELTNIFKKREDYPSLVVTTNAEESDTSTIVLKNAQRYLGDFITTNRDLGVTFLIWLTR